MTSRRNKEPPYDEHVRQPSGLVHPDAIHHREAHPATLLLENKLMSQEEEIEQLAKDNHKLASSHLALRQDLVAAQQDADELRDHIRSIQTEADIQVRIWLDKIAKAEADIEARENIKMELQEVHIEAQRLETSRQELTAKFQQATKELDTACEDLKRLPEMPAELDNLRQEHQGLRESFEYEKALNAEKVEGMKTLEKDLIKKAEEAVRLLIELSNAERASALALVPSPPPFNGHVCYMDTFDRPHRPAVGGGSAMEGINPYPNGGFSVDDTSDPWGGPFEASRLL